MQTPFSNEEKERFTAAWVEYNDPFKAALSLFPADDSESTPRALLMATSLPNDVYVLKLKNEMLNGGKDCDGLPTKGQFARSIIEMTNSDRIPITEKRHLLRLYAEVMGFVVKPNEGETAKSKPLPSAPVYKIVDR